MLACPAISLVLVVMMWLSARPSYGAGRRWWGSAAVRVIAAGMLIKAGAAPAVRLPAARGRAAR